MALGDYWLNGTRLDNNNRSYSQIYEEYGAKERMLDGSLRADIAARKWSFDFAWDYLPDSSAGTYHSYSSLRTIAFLGGTYTFILPVGTGTGTAQYTVMLDPPTADMQLRLEGTNVYWNVGLKLLQV